jgi:hypothetical protein
MLNPHPPLRTVGGPCAPSKRSPQALRSCTFTLRRRAQGGLDVCERHDDLAARPNGHLAFKRKP